MGLLFRWIGRLVVAVVALLAVSAAPILFIETRCQAPRQEAGIDPVPRVIGQAPWRRPEIQSYLSYPEWYIVHAYEDFAGVVKTRDEQAFDYAASITGFWSSLCDLSLRSTRQDAMSFDMKSMLYTIGVSFTAEMIVKGTYEETIGRLAAWWRGPVKNAEDQFATDVSERYARFLAQTPWYEFPFAATVRRFWAEAPFGRDSALRSVERRFALTAEYGVKAGYAALIAQAAGLAPADLRIRSVVGGLDAQALGADPRVKVIDETDGAVVIETDRYRAFTLLIQDLVAKGARFREIAGNRTALVTVLSPIERPVQVSGAEQLFAFPLQARPGWQRLGLAVPIDKLDLVIQAAKAAGGRFEHLYDY
ncbi:MAG: hypothetical protein J0H01_28715 [Rhizobiales bacterium]|nr:hypothetical protein [Hyphomicrobiales bacterium]